MEISSLRGREKGNITLRMLAGCKTKYRDRRGFTMAEVLVVVAILVILFALLVPNLIKTHKDLRQKEMDAKAEVLYIAAQNQLTKLRASGNTSAYKDVFFSSDNNLALQIVSLDSGDYYVLIHNKNSNSCSWMTGAADESLLSQNWAIVYDMNGNVVDVFFSETEFDINAILSSFPSWWDKWRDRAERYGNDFGYYGANGSDSSGNSGGNSHGGIGNQGGGTTPAPTPPPPPEIKLYPKVSLTTGEKLIAHLSCTAENLGTIRPSYKLRVYDAAAFKADPDTDRYFEYHVYMSADGTQHEEQLDVLNGRRFTELDSLYDTGSKLTPGCDICLRLIVTAGDETESADSETVNSLFDHVSGTTAYVSCGRHLQNLDKTGSGVSGITAAVQEHDISFGTGSAWYKAYHDQQPALQFTPITNPELVSYNGKNDSGHQSAIKGLTTGVASNSASGLFAVIAPATPTTVRLSNIRLIGTTTKTAQVSGALVGKVSGPCKIINCGVYLEPADLSGKSLNATNDWFITAVSAAGSLVGEQTQSSLEITYSYAATLLHSYGASGGLVGKVSGGTLKVSNSYADCYIYGNQTGGLVGAGAATVSNCYAAGFQYANYPDTAVSAGLVNGAATVSNSYTVCSLGNAKTQYSTVPTGSLDRVYYLVNSRENEKNLGSPIGGTDESSRAALQSNLPASDFAASSGTRAYRLGVHPEGDYPYPALKDASGTAVMKHFGDWLAGFREGSLVYYEKYLKGGSPYYCFTGEVPAELNDDLALKGDGYGVAFSSNIARLMTVTLTDGAGNATEVEYNTAAGSTATMKIGDQTETVQIYSAAAADGTVYYIYPLPKELLNAEPAASGLAGFWLKTTISSTSDSVANQNYWFSPYFANTQTTTDPQGLYPTNIVIRTPRQLYALSLWYRSKWSSMGALFQQTHDIDYAVYDWAGFYQSGVSRITEQAPIGNPFNSAYDGDCHIITNISFTGGSGYSNLGLFGSTTGYLQDIVIAADAANGCFVKRTGSVSTNEILNMGVLTGRNYGTIYNCAVTGYRLAGANPDGAIFIGSSTLYVGGLVGSNESTGTIENCSAVTSGVSLTALYANASVGGFAGQNQGVIRNSYAIADVVAESRYSKVRAAGFAGANTGRISGSYCTVSIEAIGGASSYGFTPVGGQVTDDCYYLSSGIYSYLGKLHSYDGGGSDGDGKARSYKQLSDLSWTAPVYQRNSLYHSASSGAYPFRGVVKKGIASVHYGDWPTGPQLGMFGVFYWELEQGGSNDGYHISYLGRSVDGTLVSNSTLCTAHDDGGEISAYGYGWYGLEDQPLSYELTGIRAGEHVNETVQAALQKQMPGYTFMPYVSGYPSSSADKDYLYTDGLRQNGSVKVTCGTGSEAKNDTYILSPFFANALSRTGNTVSGVNANQWAAPGSEGNPYEVRSAQQLQFINWNSVTHSSDTLVTASNGSSFPYLQYASSGSTRQYKANVIQYRPIQYWLQSHDLHGDDVTGYTPIAGMATSSSTTSAESPIYAWFGGGYDGQSYKIQNLPIVSDSYTVGLFGVTIGAEIQGIILSGDGTKNAGGQPLARVVRDTSLSGGQVGTKVGAYQVGGLIALAYDYDVSSAASVTTISNCAISGYTVKDSSTNQHGMGYASVGGLIGLSQVKLQRCSAVTTLICDYHSLNGYSQYGNSVRLGGLAGTALFEVSDCYTGGRILVDKGATTEENGVLTPDFSSTLYERPQGYSDTKTTGLNRCKALHIYVGGVVGTCYKNGIKNFRSDNNATTDGELTVSNCYTYMELPDIEGNVRAVSMITGAGDRFHRGTKITAVNCHYLQSVFDGIEYNPPGYYFNLENEKNTDTYAIDEDDESYHLDRVKKNSTYTLTPTEINDIKLGNLNSLCKIVVNQYQNFTQGGVPGSADAYQKQETYETLNGNGMASTLNGTFGSAWGWVTVTENGNDVSGKYSFSDEPSQEGKDYPFPAVVTQGTDADDNPIYVHYGAWPLNGAYWTEGRPTMNIFTDMKAESAAPDVSSTFTVLLRSEAFLGMTKEDLAKLGTTEDYTLTDGAVLESASAESNTVTLKLSAAPSLGAVTVTENQTGASATAQLIPAEKDLTLHLPARYDGELGNRTFTLSDNSIAQVVRVAPGPNGDRQNLTVTLRAVKPGIVTVKDNATQATCVVTITGEPTLTASPGTLHLTGAPVTVNCRVSPEFINSANGRWTVTKDANAAITLEPADSETFTVSGSVPGDCSVTVSYRYSYYGTELSGTTVIPVRTMGYIGLANGSAYVAANRIAAEGAEPKLVTTPEVEDLAAAAPQGADLFLFTPAAESDLEDFEILEIRVRGAGEEDAVVYSADAPANVNTAKYAVAFFTADGSDNGPGSGHPLVTTLGDRRCYGAAVSLQDASGTAPTASVTVTVRLRDPAVVNAAADGGKQQYTLVLENVTAYRNRVVFHKNADTATGIMHALGLGADASALPESGFTRTGYAFNGWYASETGGEALTELSSGSGIGALYAGWTPNTYSVILKPHNGTDQTDGTITMQYDDGEDDAAAPEGVYIRLPNYDALGFTPPQAEGKTYAFAGWSTEPDGQSGTMYPAGSKNLSDGKETVTLYARWNLTLYTLTLSANGTEYPYTPDSGADSLADYVPVTKDGWSLDGWYTAADGSGVKVLNADGTVVGSDAPGCTLSGYTSSGTFALTQDQTLYARWSRTAYVIIDKLAPEVDEQGSVVLDKNGRTSCDGTYLIANGNTGAVKLMANTGGDTFKSADATVTTPDAAYPLFDQNGILTAPYILSFTLPQGTSNEAAPLWNVRYRAAALRAYNDPEGKPYPRFEFLNTVNGEGMYDMVGYSLRDNLNKSGNVIQLLANGKYSYSYGTEYNNRNLWTYGTRASGMMMSEFNDVDSKLGYTLGLSGEKWGIAANQTCYLFKQQTIYTFE